MTDDWVPVHGFEPLNAGSDAIPTEVAPSRGCDFCFATPTTYWLSFAPVPQGVGLTLPSHLGACDACAASLDFRNPEDLMAHGNCDADEAQMIARYLDSVTAGR
jgi:hypothetical protein